jgi:hypothetical protein
MNKFRIPLNDPCVVIEGPNWSESSYVAAAPQVTFCFTSLSPANDFLSPESSSPPAALPATGGS